VQQGVLPLGWFWPQKLVDMILQGALLPMYSMPLSDLRHNSE